MRLSVIIPLFRHRRRVARSLRALEEQTLDRSLFELIFVDDGSDDGTAEAVAAWPTTIERQVLVNATNQGRSRTRNRGVSHASGDVLVFLDGDMIPHPDLLRSYHARFVADGCDVVTGSRRCLDLLTRPELEPMLDEPGYMNLREYTRPGQLPFQAQLEQQIEQVCRDYPDASTRALAFITSNVAVTRQAFAETRGFFPGLSRFEDTDLGLQLIASGARFACARGAEAIHPFDSVNATVREHEDAFAALVTRHPFIPVVLWWCWGLAPNGEPSLLDIARMESDKSLGAYDWRALARGRGLPLPGEPTIPSSAIAASWRATAGMTAEEARSYLSRARSANVLHVVGEDGEARFDLASLTSWLGDHTDDRQRRYRRSMFSLRGAVHPGASRTIRWRGRYEVEIPGALVDRGTVVNLALPVDTAGQEVVTLTGWDPPELAHHRHGGMIAGAPIAAGGRSTVLVGYSFECRVHEYTPRGAPGPVDRERWLRPHSLGGLEPLAGLLERIPSTSEDPIDRAHDLYRFMLDSTEQRANALPALSTAATGIGHCIQLTRLYVSLCRRAGIPARERCGVLVDRIRDGGGALAAETAESFTPFAHTWAEVWCAQRGWLPVELMSIAHGKRALTPWNVPDLELRQRICDEGEIWDRFYFGGLDAFRIHASKWANELPTLMREHLDWESVLDPELKIRHRLRFEGEVA